jgi:phosphoadenosine phosphosulfate reductase
MTPATNLRQAQLPLRPIKEDPEKLRDAVARFAESVERYRHAGARLFASSSFQTHSLPLLHLLSRFAPETPVYFLDTGFHFPETLAFRNHMAQQMQLNVLDLRSPVGKMGQRDGAGQLLFASDPDHCCYLNKTLPLDSILPRYDVWISGLRRDQNNYRKQLSEVLPGPYGTERWHPMLEWNARMIWQYRQAHELPEHPLEAKGYLSVGCEPCTERYLDSTALGSVAGNTAGSPAEQLVPVGAGEDAETARGGRWAGLRKTECGLHTDLMAKP